MSFLAHSPPPPCLQFQPPFAGQDPVEAARQAALYERRPQFVALLQPHPHKKEIRTLIARCWSPNPGECGRLAVAVLVVTPAMPVESAVTCPIQHPRSCTHPSSPSISHLHICFFCDHPLVVGAPTPPPLPWPPAEDRPTFVEIAEELEGILSKMPRTALVKTGSDAGCCSVA